MNQELKNALVEIESAEQVEAILSVKKEKDDTDKWYNTFANNDEDLESIYADYKSKWNHSTIFLVFTGKPNILIEEYARINTIHEFDHNKDNPVNMKYLIVYKKL